jgi:hypothetical protein
MTRDDIMRMARETDCLDDQHYGSVWADKLERFANLIAALEREECAKVCDDLPVPPYVPDNDAHIWELTCVDCAFAIRERGAP